MKEMCEKQWKEEGEKKKSLEEKWILQEQY